MHTYYAPRSYFAYIINYYTVCSTLVFIFSVCAAFIRLTRLSPNSNKEYDWLVIREGRARTSAN